MSSYSCKYRKCHPVAVHLERDHLYSAGYLLGGDQLPLAGAGTNFTRLFPRVWVFDIALPEGPGAALTRPNRINGASRLSIVEDTFTVRLFTESTATGPETRMDRDELFERLPTKLSDRLDLTLAYPDKPRFTRAAVAATRTLKPQSILVPGI